MVQKVVLGKRPAFIRRDIEVLMPEGEINTIRVDYKYFTRREFAALVDKLIAKANEALQQVVAAVDETPAETPLPAAKPAAKSRGAKGKATATSAPSPVVIRTERVSVDEALAASSQQLLEIMVGWNLDVPLSLPALDQLCDEIPGSFTAITAGLRKAINEGHSGN